MVSIERPSFWRRPAAPATPAANEAVHFYGEETTASGAVRIGWALWESMRSWGVNSEAELSDWLGRNGFPATQLGHHIVAGAQEHILTAEWQGRRKSSSARRNTHERRHNTDHSWEQMDQINLEESFLRRVSDVAESLISCGDGSATV